MATALLAGALCAPLFLTSLRAARAQGDTGDTPAEGAPDAPLVDSLAWQAHFEHWVERELVRGQIEEASRELLAFDSGARTLEVLDELETKRLVALRELPRLPEGSTPRVLASGLGGAAAEAAHAYAEGEPARALEILAQPRLADDVQAVHLRAQILDELSEGMHPIYRLRVIRTYREAVRLAENIPEADRARIRIAQIFLQIGFVPEARAALSPHFEAGFAETYRTAALITLAEATFLDRDPTRTIELLARLDLTGLRGHVRDWELRRRADSLFNLERFPEARDLYMRLLEDGRRVPSDALLGIRFGFTLLLGERRSDAIDVLETVLERQPSPELEAVARLVLARALREEGEHERAMLMAARVPALWPLSRTAALGAVEALEAARLSGKTSLTLPKGASAMVEPTSAVPEFALLSYRVGIMPGPGDGPDAPLQRIGTVLVSLDEGPVQRLAQDDLTHRVSADLARYATGAAAPDPSRLDLVENYMRPRIMAENELLLAIESLFLADRRAACVRWSSALQRRENRPLRRGTASWRRARCLGTPATDLNAAQRLLIDADTGETGSFALALAALAAEIHVRRDELETATDAYSRAVQALGEPRLVGPAVLRLGELEAAIGRKKLARRDLMRGLALTSDAGFASDPLRKAGLLALVRLEADADQRQQLLSLLAAERERVESWWSDAYAYLTTRVGGDGPIPGGDGSFARGMRELAAVDGLAGRLQRLVREKGATQ
jgi:tetratricopeptide (TPR) repeat protein